MLKAGTRIGPYEVIAQIGAGGMGEVYRARDPRLGRDVAIKVLPPDFAGDAERLRRFEQEARTIGSLNHPNLLGVFDVGMDGSVPFLVMELLEGETLRERLAGKPLPPKKALEIARAAAEGLAAAHGKGVIHRDLKPENLFLCRDGRTKILDFGLAKLTRPGIGPECATQALVSQPGVVVGTVAYMSPEQARGEALDTRSDLFSLGIILWEMLTGQAPFHRPSTIETMHAILKDEIPDPEPSLKLSPVLLQIIHRCLAKHPEGRFHAASDLAFALGHLSGSGSTSSDITKALPAQREQRWWLLALGMAAALGLAFLGGQVLAQPREPKIERLTSARRVVTSAKFLPDGRSTVFTGSVDGAENPALYLQRPGETPQPLGVENCRILGVSPKGDIGLWIGGPKPVLAIRPAAGGAPKVIQEDFTSPNDAMIWPIGESDPIIKHHNFKGQQTQAFTFKDVVLYEVPWGYGVGNFAYLDTSQKLVFIEFRSNMVGLTFVPLAGGNPRFIQIPDSYNYSLFAVDNRLIALEFVHGGRGGSRIVELTSQGRELRTLRTFEDAPVLWDVNQAGELLLSPDFRSDPYALLAGVRWLEPGSARERTISFKRKNWSSFLNQDGTHLGFNCGEAAILKQGNQDPLYIGHSALLGISPDASWAIVSTSGGTRNRSKLVPLGEGKPIDLPGNWYWADWFFCGNSEDLFVWGRRAEDGDMKLHAYLCHPSKGTLSPLPLPIAYAQGPVSPDGRFAFSSNRANADIPWKSEWGSVELRTGKVKQFPDSCRQMWPVGWALRGEGVWLVKPTKDGGFPIELWRYDLRSNKTEKHKEIVGPETTKATISQFTISNDGSSYAYSFDATNTTPTDLIKVSFK